MYKISLIAFFAIYSFTSFGQKIIRFDIKQYKEKGKIGFKDPNGVVIVAAAFDWAEEFYKFKQNRLKVGIGGKMGFMDTTGKLVIPCKYTDAKEFDNEGRCIVFLGKEGELAGCIGVNGEVIVPVIYEDLIYSAGYSVMMQKYTFWATSKKKKLVLDVFGRIKFTHSYKDLTFISLTDKGNYSVNDTSSIIKGGGFYVVEKDGKFGTVDENNKIIIPLQYEFIDTNAQMIRRDKKLKARLKGKELYIDFTGKVV
jgi:hypothetical protein